MARSLRIQSAGAYYHVLARGDRGKVIFHDDEDRHFFLDALGQACERTGWRVHAWVLMGHHYHLFLQTPEPNLVEGMSWLQNALTRRYNTRHRKRGRLFGDRYKAVVVEGEDHFYYQTLMDYVHLNPVRSRRVRPKEGQSVLDYPWSSLAGGYALPAGKRPVWLAAESGLKAFELSDTLKGRRAMVKRLDERAGREATKSCGVPELAADADARASHLRRGWYWGTRAFGDELKKVAAAAVPGKTPRARAKGGRAPVREHGVRQAETWLKLGLQAAGLKRGQLQALKGSDARKVLLADLLWRRTVVSLGWLAEKLAMKSAANVGQRMRQLDAREALKRVPQELAAFLAEAEAAEA